MPWFIGDHVRHTMHLDHVQDGAYRSRSMPVGCEAGKEQKARTVEEPWIELSVTPSALRQDQTEGIWASSGARQTDSKRVGEVMQLLGFNNKQL
jgi:hypothetical protein